MLVRLFGGGAMAWLWLVCAGVCEMMWPLGYQWTNGFTTKYWLAAITGAVMLSSFGFMTLAVRGGISVGTTYAVWTGFGATGTVVLGMWLFGESRNPIRLVCLTLIVLGVIGLKFLTTEGKKTDAREAPATAPALAAEAG